MEHRHGRPRRQPVVSTGWAVNGDLEYHRRRVWRIWRRNTVKRQLYRVRRDVDAHPDGPGVRRESHGQFHQPVSVRPDAYVDARHYSGGGSASLYRGRGLEPGEFGELDRRGERVSGWTAFCGGIMLYGTYLGRYGNGQVVGAVTATMGDSGAALGWHNTASNGGVYRDSSGQLETIPDQPSPLTSTRRNCPWGLRTQASLGASMPSWAISRTTIRTV